MLFWYQTARREWKPCDHHQPTNPVHKRRGRGLLVIDLEPAWVPGNEPEWLIPQRVPQSQARLEGPLLQGSQPLTSIRAGGLPLALGVQSSAASIIPLNNKTAQHEQHASQLVLCLGTAFQVPACTSQGGFCCI